MHDQRQPNTHITLCLIISVQKNVQRTLPLHGRRGWTVDFNSLHHYFFHPFFQRDISCKYENITEDFERMKQIVISNFQQNTALNKYDNISQCKNNPFLSSWKLDNRPESCDNVTSIGLFTFCINIFYGFLTPFLLVADSLFLKLTIHL